MCIIYNERLLQKSINKIDSMKPQSNSSSVTHDPPPSNTHPLQRVEPSLPNTNKSTTNNYSNYGTCISLQIKSLAGPIIDLSLDLQQSRVIGICSRTTAPTEYVHEPWLTNFIPSHLIILSTKYIRL
jgi:hypothetical protein